MGEMPIEKDILLKVTPAIPYLGVCMVALAFISLAYLTKDDESFVLGVNLLLFAGISLPLFYAAGHRYLRSLKNKLNNYCFEKSKALKINDDLWLKWRYLMVKIMAGHLKSWLYMIISCFLSIGRMQ